LQSPAREFYTINGADRATSGALPSDAMSTLFSAAAYVRSSRACVLKGKDAAATIILMLLVIMYVLCLVTIIKNVA
jgi:hypothetical protein